MARVANDVCRGTLCRHPDLGSNCGDAIPICRSVRQYAREIQSMRSSAFNCRQFVSVLAMLLALLAVAEHADARRASGGGFGSRGTRTFQAPPTTTVAPTTAVPIQRTMTPQPQINQTTPIQPQGTAPRPGFFSNFGGSLVGGLLVGGLVGALLGYGFGGGVGILGMLLQIGIVVGAIMLVMRFIRGRQGQASSASAPIGQGMFNGLAGLGLIPSSGRAGRLGSTASNR